MTPRLSIPLLLLPLLLLGCKSIPPPAPAPAPDTTPPPTHPARPATPPAPNPPPPPPPPPATHPPPAATYPARPATPPAPFKLFHHANSSFTLVVKETASDDAISSLVWQLRDAARTHTFDALHIPQKQVDSDRKSVV